MKEPQYDWNKVAMLLHVASELRQYPKLDRMHQQAMNELQDICDEPFKQEENKSPAPEPVVDEASHVDDERKAKTVKTDPIDLVTPPENGTVERRV